jgi:hypothetical protein
MNREGFQEEAAKRRPWSVLLFRHSTCVISSLSSTSKYNTEKALYRKLLSTIHPKTFYTNRFYADCPLIYVV